MRHAVVAALLASLSMPGWASASIDGTRVAWSGTGELGLAVSRGNTDSQTLVGKLGLGKEEGQWKHAVAASFLYGRNNDVENASRYDLAANSGYQINDRHYGSASLRHERDHFAAKEYQWTAAFGYGFDAIDDERTRLRLEIGPGYRWAKLQGVREHKNEAVARGSLTFRHEFNKNTSIYDNVLLEAGDENTYVRNDVGVHVKMTDALALKAGLEVRHNTNVAAGRRNTDTLSTINVVYGF